MNSRLKKNLKKRRAAAQAEEEPEFQVAPMADVLFVLLVFFMSITSTETLSREKGLNLPKAESSRAGESDKAGGEVVVNVKWTAQNQPTFTVGQKEMTVMTLSDELRRRKADNENLRVLIRADRNVYYREITNIMQLCASAGIGNVTFATIKGGQS